MSEHLAAAAGELVSIGPPQELTLAGSGPTAATSAGTGATELAGLPGVGAKTAARIVEYRQKNGPFRKIEELMNVQGIGEKSFLKLKPQLTVGAAKADHDRQDQR